MVSCGNDSNYFLQLDLKLCFSAMWEADLALAEFYHTLSNLRLSLVLTKKEFGISRSFQDVRGTMKKPASAKASAAGRSK